MYRKDACAFGWSHGAAVEFIQEYMHVVSVDGEFGPDTNHALILITINMQLR